MHKINIVAVGNLKEKYWIDATSEYLKRLTRFANVDVKEVAEFIGTSKTSIEQIKTAECEKLSEKIDGYVIAMDKGGSEISSEQLAELINKAFLSGNKSISFIIGGSHGLTEKIKKNANKIISFGKITYPHQLMRVVLLEQIYRAETILNNISYHK